MQSKDSKILADRFRDFGAPASSTVWAGIEASLVEQQKRRRGIIWWSLAALFVLSALAYNFNASEGEDRNESILGLESTSTKKSATNKKWQNGTTIKRDAKNQKKEFTTLANKKTDGTINSKDRIIPRTNFSKPKPKTEPTPIKFVDPISINESDALKELPYLSFTALDYANQPNRPIDPTAQVISKIVILPKWEFGVRGNGFLNVSTPTVDQNNLSSFGTAPGSNVSPANKSFSHRRHFELEAYTLCYLRPKLVIGMGLTGSMGLDRELWNNYKTISNRTTFGLPIYGRYSLIRKGRFRLDMELGLLNEYASVKSSSGEVSPSVNNQSDPALGFSENLNWVGTEYFSSSEYAFGLHGGLDASYKLLYNFSITASLGYRNYLIESYSLDYNYVKNPGYLTGGIGVRWSFRR